MSINVAARRAYRLISQLLFLLLLAIVFILSVCLFRRLVAWIDSHTDDLASKYASQPRPFWARLVPVVGIILMLFTLTVVAVGVMGGLTIGSRWYLTAIGSRFIVMHLDILSVIGGIAAGVCVATMIVIPLTFARLAPEPVQWAYLYLNYSNRPDVSLRVLMSAGYVVAAIGFPIVGVSDYVRLTDSEICRRHFADFTEYCIPYQEVERFELSQEVSRSGNAYPELRVYVDNKVWVNIRPGITSAAEVRRIWAYITSQPGVRAIEY